MNQEYDPVVRREYPVAVRTVDLVDDDRNRTLPCEVWCPDLSSGSHPLVVYSHPAGGNRRSASFLCDHLSSHGYVVAALEHSERKTRAARRGSQTAYPICLAAVDGDPRIGAVAALAAGGISSGRQKRKGYVEA